jgi:hypothetical protein
MMPHRVPLTGDRPTGVKMDAEFLSSPVLGKESGLGGDSWIPYRGRGN